MSTAAVLSEYRTIPLSLIDESTTNPRRTFEPSKLVELAQSISTHGLLQPITVRQKEDRFEIIAGARRYRAAQIAELADLPTRVLELNDAQTLEAQLIENSQREDVHPYEEASGYQRLLDLPGYDVATLVEKSGKSPAHVYSRLTLLSLIPDVAESFQKEEITASHANLLARLNAEQQALAFPHAFRKDWNDSEKHLLPAKALATWIQDNLYLALAEAPFDTQSATLLPEAGSCPACPKRTGFNTALFADITDDNCLDGSCFRAKINAHIESAKSGISNLVQISTIWRPAKDKPANELAPGEFRYIVKSGQEMPDSPTCESMAPAIVTYGHGVGIIHAICANHDCPAHYPNPHFDGETREKWQAEQERQAAERKQRDEEKARREERLRALILRFPSSVTAGQMRFLLTALLTGNVEYGAERIAMRFDEENTDNRMSSEEVCIDAINRCLPSSLFGYLAELALGSLVTVPREDERDFVTEAEQVFPVQTVQPTQVKKVPAKGKAKKIAAKKTAAVKAVAKTKRR